MFAVPVQLNMIDKQDKLLNLLNAVLYSKTSSNYDFSPTEVRLFIRPVTGGRVLFCGAMHVGLSVRPWVRPAKRSNLL